MRLLTMKNTSKLILMGMSAFTITLLKSKSVSVNILMNAPELTLPKMNTYCNN